MGFRQSCNGILLSKKMCGGKKAFQSEVAIGVPGGLSR